jgi:predicted Zn-dependent protease
VQDLGRQLASRSERPDLDWTFRVVDDPVVNAFALPGGFIYVTRGILAHMNNEAELASVLGHEIGHVTARHSVSQLSKAQLTQLGLGVGAIAAPEYVDRYGALLSTGVGLLFLKFSRDDERQADDLGLRYMITAGYDPEPMVDMFEMLDRVSEGSGGGRVPGWMSTHPAPENRGARTRSRIARLDEDFSGWAVDRDEFLARIDGLAFGDDPRQGYFDGADFYHPELRFRMVFPEGWRTQNTRGAVIAGSPEEDAIVQLTLFHGDDPESALQEFLSRSGMRRTGPRMGSISGFRTAGDGFIVTNEQGNVRGRVGFVEYGDHLYRLIGYCPEYRWAAYETTIRRSLASFDRLTDRRALDVRPKRVKIVRVDRAMTLDEFARLHEATVPVETLAVINRIDSDARVEPGRPYKTVTGGTLP